MGYSTKYGSAFILLCPGSININSYPCHLRIFTVLAVKESENAIDFSVNLYEEADPVPLGH